MYELHSTHTNPEPNIICGSVTGIRGEDICVTTYHQSWLPGSLTITKCNAHSNLLNIMLSLTVMVNPTRRLSSLCL